MIHKKSKKMSKRFSKSKSKTNNKCKKTKRNIKKMRGGVIGGYNVSGSYFGMDKSGYYNNGDEALKSKPGQHDVSQGSLWPGNQLAGPNMSPHSGGGCGCRKEKRKSKNKKNKKHN